MVDMTARIEAQVERFAPGFRDLILAPPRDDTGRPRAPQRQLHRRRHRRRRQRPLADDRAADVSRVNPYAVPVRGWYLCSASTPPGGGVHGMGGFNAARSALRSLGIRQMISASALFGGSTTSEYWITRLLLQRGLGGIYLIAFVVAVNQFRPLLGTHGLTPCRSCCRTRGSSSRRAYSFALLGSVRDGAVVVGRRVRADWP